MGNIVQCCVTLTNYFKCKDAPVQREVERSPLLSSEESECDSPSLSDETAVTNPALEPEHFLFPDIILSSNLGGDVTLVEPMVCLLVCEEEEGLGEVGDEGQERSNTGRHRGYSEVETQTEGDTYIGMGVQTQTESQAEVQTQTERPVGNNTKEILKQAAVLSEPQTDTQTSNQRLLETVTDVLSEKLNKRTTWSDMDGPEKEERQSENNKRDPGDTGEEAKEENLKEHHVHECVFQTELEEELNDDEGDVFKLQQSNATAQEVATVGSDQHVPNIIPTTTNISCSEDNTDLTSLETDHVQSQDGEKTDVQHVLELEMVLPQLEQEGAEMKQMTLFLVDRLFLAPSRVAGV